MQSGQRWNLKYDISKSLRFDLLVLGTEGTDSPRNRFTRTGFGCSQIVDPGLRDIFFHKLSFDWVFFSFRNVLFETLQFKDTVPFFVVFFESHIYWVVVSFFFIFTPIWGRFLF